MNAIPAIEPTGSEFTTCAPIDAGLKPGLSWEEERLLPARVAAGDHEARNRMVLANLGLVKKIAREFLGRGLGLEDLIAEGNLGLLRAAEEFDPSFGARFSTYASFWIRQSIRHALINTTATIRLPAHMVTLITKFQRAARALARERGCDPTFDEVADHLRLGEVHRSLLTHAIRARHVERGMHSGGDGREWSSLQWMYDDTPPESELLARELADDVKRRVESLDDRERTILHWRYWMDGRGLTYAEISRRLGFTREWVRILELRALEKLALNY